MSSIIIIYCSTINMPHYHVFDTIYKIYDLFRSTALLLYTQLVILIIKNFVIPRIVTYLTAPMVPTTAPKWKTVSMSKVNDIDLLNSMDMYCMMVDEAKNIEMLTFCDYFYMAYLP